MLRTVKAPGASVPAMSSCWCVAHGKTHPISWFDREKSSCRRAEKVVQRLTEEARAAGLHAYVEPGPEKPDEMSNSASWLGVDAAILLMRVSKETRRQWYALFDRDPEWCRRAFAEFAAAAYAAEG